MSCSELALSVAFRSSLVSVLGCYAEDPGSSPRLCYFFYNHVYNGYYGDHNISLTFKLFAFFVFFPSFAHIPEREERS
jgi:hypothetical protein